MATTNSRITRRQILEASLAAAIFLAGCGLQLALAADPGFDSQGRNKLPRFADIEAVVEGHFEGLDMDPRDLVTQDDVKPVFAKIKAAGWQVPDPDEILKMVPANDEPWVVELRSSKAGQRFARQVGRYPAGFDKVDRMCRMPHGLTQLSGLIYNPAGWKYIAYLTISPGGHNLGEMVSRAPKGKHFNSRTGRIYTQGELLARLRESYDEQIAEGYSVQRGR
ncbi:MAG: hypothetical protein AB7U73_11820 [Pirellulales bacterium]